MSSPSYKMDTSINSFESVANSPTIVVNLRNTRIAAASALLYIVVLGILTSYTAPATADMKKSGSRFRNITPDQITWIGSLPNLGCIFGDILSGYLSQKFGRKAVLMLTSSVYMASWFIVAYAPTMIVIFIGRFIGGVCAGMLVVAVPTYIVEISPTEIRGQLSSGFQIAYTVGVLFVMMLGIFVRWSWLAISGAAVVACASCFMLFMPESPPWLIQNAHLKEAEKELIFLRGKESDYQKEMKELFDNITQEQQHKIYIREFMHREVYKPIGIALSLMFFQQASGISPLLSYTVEIFSATNSSIDPGTAATIVALVQVVGAIFSGFLMDRSGRKRLFMFSGVCMSVALGVMGVYSFVIKHSTESNSKWGYVPLISFTLYIFSFSIGSGPVPYVSIPEMVPIKFRSMVMAISGVWCSILAFGTNKIFENMRSLLEDSGVYWTYGSLSFLSAVFGYFFLPETKGLTTQQISQIFSLSTVKF